MSGIVNISGEQEAIRWARILTNGIKRDVVKTLTKAQSTMPAHARSRHKFNSITGEVDRSIKATIETSGGFVTFTFFMEKVPTSSGYNRGWILNDGTYGSYKRGKISPTARTVGGKRGTGIKHDDFMGNAWEQNSKVLFKAIQRIMDRMN